MDDQISDKRKIFGLFKEINKNFKNHNEISLNKILRLRNKANELRFKFSGEQLINCDLSYLSLIDINATYFSGYEYLEILDLSNNNFSELPEGIFKQFTQLKSLNLSNNQFADLPENIFSDLTNLNALYLDNNELISLPTSLFSLLNLEVLFVKNNNLDETWNKNLSSKNETLLYLSRLHKEKTTSKKYLTMSKDQIQKVIPYIFEYLEKIKTETDKTGQYELNDFTIRLNNFSKQNFHNSIVKETLDYIAFNGKLNRRLLKYGKWISSLSELHFQPIFPWFRNTQQYKWIKNVILISSSIIGISFNIFIIYSKSPDLIGTAITVLLLIVTFKYFDR